MDKAGPKYMDQGINKIEGPYKFSLFWNDKIKFPMTMGIMAQ
jgi:hypothetical protein